MAQNTPQWLKNAIIYEVYVPGYSRSGTFDGVTADLQRIRDLGTDILWLMPIHPIGEVGRKGSLGSPYAIKDYRAINPLLGDEAGLNRLINETHQLGMKIIIDVVYHHTANDSQLIETHPEWFAHDESGRFTRKIESWSDITDLDYSHHELWTYLIDTLKIWLDKGIDGFRCDVAPMVPLDFWKEARKVLEEDREVIWLAESVHRRFVKELRDRGFIAHADPELHEAFDLTYDYDGFEYLEKYFWGEENGLNNYINHLSIQETLYPVHAIKMRFLENHDIQRIGSIIRNKSVLKNWVVFYALLPGATLIYAGQEVLVRKNLDFFERDLIDWNNGDWEFNDFFKKVMRLAKIIKAECHQFKNEEIGDRIFKINWKSDDQEYIGVVSLTEKHQWVNLGLDLAGTDLITMKYISFADNISIETFPVIIKV